jgi:MFS family permease
VPPCLRVALILAGKAHAVKMEGMGALFQRHPALLRLALIALLAELGYAIIVPTLPLYLSEALQAPDRLIGWIVTAFAVVETLLQGPFGALGDRIGRKPLIVVGLALSALTPLLMTVIHASVWFIPLRALDGGGSAALWPAVLATVGDEVDEAERGTGMALFNVTYMIGLGLGPPLGLWISHTAGGRIAAFYIAATLMATAGLGAALLLPGRLPHIHPHSAADAGALHAGNEDAVVDEGHPLSLTAALRAMIDSARAQPALRIMFALGFAHRFALTLLQPILPLYARRQAGLNDLQLSYLFLIPALAIGALALPFGRLADRAPRVRAIQVGFAVSAVALAMVPTAHSVAALAALATVLGLAFIFAEPAWLALVSTLAPEGRQGTALGGVGAAQGLGFLLGPVIGGRLNEDVGPAAPFLLCALLLAGCLVLTTAARRRLVPGAKDVTG